MDEVYGDSVEAPPAPPDAPPPRLARLSGTRRVALAVAVVHDDEPLPEGLDDEDDDVACSDLTAGFGDLAMGCFALNFGGDGEDDDAGGDGVERRSFILS